MANHRLRGVLRHLLPLVDALPDRRDDIERARELGSRKREAAARLGHRQAVARARSAAVRALAGGRLVGILPAAVTQPDEAILALRLFSLRLADGPEPHPARELLGALDPEPLARQAAARLLAPAAPLRATGVVAGAAGAADILDEAVRAADGWYLDLCRRLEGSAPDAVEPDAPYRDAAEHTLHWHTLATLHRRRATLRDGDDTLGEFAVDGFETLDEVRHAIDATRERIAARTAATPFRETLPLRRLARVHGLGETELLALVTCLYVPVLVGSPGAPPGLLARALSDGPGDALAALAILRPGGRLHEAGLVRTLGEDDAPDAAVEVALAPAVETELLAGLAPAGGLDPGDRRTFGRFLDDLPDSGPFYRGLGLDGPGKSRPRGR